MAVKKIRILKKEWPTFIKDFNRQNQFRRATMTLGEDVLVGNPGMPLTGLAYDPDNRVIEIYMGKDDPDDLAHLAHRVEVPRAVYLIRDDEAANPVVGLQIQGPPKSKMAVINFVDVDPQEVRLQWTANVAYALYERRGMMPGDDQQDWYQAEMLIKQAAERFL